jgi:hypothetical protein
MITIRKRRLLACILLIFSTWAPAHADIAPIPGSVLVRPVFDRSDVACAGAVTSTTARDSQIRVGDRSFVRRHITASVQIVDLYKAPNPVPAQINIEYELDIDGGNRIGGSRFDLKEGQVVPLFLARTVNGAYVFADDFLGAVELPSLAKRGGDLGMGKLEFALMDDASRSTDGERLRALRLLQGLESPSEETISGIEPYIRATDSDLALTASAVMLKTKTPESVHLLRQYLDQLTGTSQPVVLVSLGAELGQVADENCERDVVALRAVLRHAVGPRPHAVMCNQNKSKRAVLFP